MNRNKNGLGSFGTERHIERNRISNCTNKTKTESASALEVRLKVDASLKGWIDNCFFRHKKNNSVEERRSLVHSVYCEVLGNGNCSECTRLSQKLSNVNRSLAKYPGLETGSYLLFRSISEKHRKNAEISRALTLSKSVSPDSGYSSQRTWRSSPTFAQRPQSHCRARTASLLASELNRLSGKNLEKSPRGSPIPWPSPTSKSVRFDSNSCAGDPVSSSRMNGARSPRTARKISAFSQEGWSVKQLEAWKLLAPTPPQIEVSQMNVSMYTPKELPGIKIFDESLFVI